MFVNNNRHYQILIIGLMLFGLSLPLSKSINSILMGLIYLYSLTLTFFYQDFRTAILRNIKQPMTLPVTIYIFVAIFGLLYTENLLNGFGIVKQASTLFFIYLMVSVLLDSGEDKEKGYKNAEYILLSFISGLYILDIAGLLTYFGIMGDQKYVLPFTPLNIHHIWVGNLNAIGLYAAVSFILFSTGRGILAKKVFIFSFIVIGIISVLLATSRTAWLGIIFTSVIFAFLSIEKKRYFFFVVLLIISSIIFLYLFNSTVHHRANEIFYDISQFLSGETDTSIGKRFVMWKASMKMFLPSPVLGVGTGDYGITIAEYVQSGQFPDFISKFNQPHNMYLFVLATNGLLGLTSLIYIYYKVFIMSKNLIKSYRKEKLFGFVAITMTIHFIFAGLTESILNIHMLISAFSLIMGISLRLSMRSNFN